MPIEGVLFLQPQRGGAGAAIFAFAMVLAYVAATIAMELQPQRLLGAFAPDLVARGNARPAANPEKRRSP